MRYGLLMTCGLVAAIVAARLDAVVLDPPEEWVPRSYVGISCKFRQQVTYDVYIPKGYNEEKNKEKLYPVVFMSGGGFHDLEAWADKSEAILITINSIYKDQKWTDVYSIQDAVLESVEPQLRLHPCLRFSTGMGWGAWAALHLANRYPDKFAGVLLNSHSGNGASAPKYVCIGMIYGDKDEDQDIETLRGAEKQFRMMGNPVKAIYRPGAGQAWGGKAQLDEMLTWMLWYSKFTHPKLPTREVQVIRGEVSQQIANLASNATPTQVVEKTETLMQIPGIEKWKEAKDLYQLWFKSKLEMAGAKKDLIDRFEAMMDLSTDEHCKGLGPKEKEELRKQVQDLQKMPELKTEVKAYAAYHAAAESEKRAKSKGAKQKVIEAYKLLVKQSPDTRFARRAGEASKRLEDELAAAKEEKGGL